MRRTSLQNGSFLILLLIVTLAFGWLVRDFGQAIFWAAVIAVLFNPWYERIRTRVNGRAGLASAVTIVIVLVVFILPIALVGMAVTREAAGFYDRVSSGQIDLQAPVDALERNLPRVGSVLARVGIDVDRLREGVAGAAVTASQFVASRALALGQNALRVGLLLVVTLYLLFFFLKDGERLLEAISRALPLGDTHERRLYARFAKVARATIKGSLIVGVVQGTLGGLLFLAVGIQAAVFWGVLMTVLSLLPAVGSGLIWGPAAIIFMVTGQVGKGIVVLVAGILVIGLVDNFLRPRLVGRDTRMPDFLVLLATLGGLAVFGLSGFVIGPVIAALFLTVWAMFSEQYGHLDDPGASGGPGPPVGPSGPPAGPTDPPGLQALDA